MNLRYYFATVGCLCALHQAYAYPRGTITQIDRYATVQNQATRAQIHPLLAIAQFHFSPSVRTIGQAIAHVLQHTSYRLAQAHHPIVQATLEKPLPLTDRTLGPLSIRDTIHILIGEDVFDLKIDPVHRTIHFKLKARMRHYLEETTHVAKN